MAVIQTPRVQVDVQAWTPQGAYYHSDLMGDLTTIQTSKTTTAAYGTFQLTFTMREDSGGSWADKLPYRTYVEMRAGIGSGTPPILMRGFVDSPEQTMQSGAFPQGPTREVTVTGRDMGAILSDWQILYLWGIDPMSTYLEANMSNGDPLAAQLGVGVGQQSPTALLTAFATKLVNGVAVKGLQSVMPQVPTVQPKISLPDAYQVNFLSLQPWQGSYSNFVDYFASPPWGEDFLYDADDGPWLVVRQTPYKNYLTGQYPLPFGGSPAANGFFADVTLDAGDIAEHDLTVNASGEIYTYYSTTPDLASSVAQSYAQFFYVSAGTTVVTSTVNSNGQVSTQNPKYPQPTATTGSSLTQTGVTVQTTLGQTRQPGSNPYYAADKAKWWGIQPLELTTPWVSTLNTAFNSNAQSLVAELNTWLVNVYGDNDKFSAGTITCHGFPSLTVGRYVVVAPGAVTSDPYPWEAYIQSISHEIDIASNNATWTTDLGVVRGRVRT